MTSECGSCGHAFEAPEDGLLRIPNLVERLTPGALVPSSECPECGALAYPIGPKAIVPTLDDSRAEDLWRQLQDIPVDDDGCILVPFMEYLAGTDREEIWRDIDKLHSRGVAHLMFHRPRESDHDD